MSLSSLGRARRLLGPAWPPGDYLACMVFLDRSRRGPDPHLRWKTAVLVVGAVLGLVGMRLENAWVVSAAIVVLLVAVALRMMRAKSQD